MTTVAERTVARNDPCPCGSGRRYKDCHGSLRAAAQPAPALRSYRPDGEDWAAIAESERERLGALMERALGEQRAGRVREAERFYRAVLEEAPNTHDALHMLGVVRLGLGDLAEAERLISQAMKLRPEYPAIATNWSLVRRTIAARDRGGIEIVCEHALPLLFESLRAARADRASSQTASRALHLVAPSVDATGGAMRLSRALASWLAPMQLQCWNMPSDGDAWQRFDRLHVDTPSGIRPGDGRAILAGVDAHADMWLDGIERVLVFAQPAPPSVLLEGLRRIAGDGARELTLVVDSHARAKRLSGGHIVLPPPIGDWRAAPMHSTRDALRVSLAGQDRQRVVAVEDEERDFIAALAARAGALDVYDPGPLRFHVGALPHVTCIAPNDAALQAMLAACDVYFQRPAPWWAEDARLMFIAMLVGRPVLCPRASVFAEYIVDGVDGFLYDDHDDALAIVGALRRDRPRVAASGEAAQAHAARRFDARALASAYVDAVTQWMRA